MRNFLKKEKGSSLVELVLYMGLISIFLFILVDMFVSILSVQLESEASSSVAQDGRFILARLAYDIERAGLISTPATAGAQTNSLQLVISGVNYTYNLQNQNLILTNNTGSNSLNGYDTSISNLRFIKYGTTSANQTLQAFFTVTSKVTRKEGVVEKQDFQTTIGIR